VSGINRRDYSVWLNRIDVNFKEIMMKRIKPTERYAFPNKVVSIVAVRTLHPKEAANDRGAYSYLKARPSVTRVERVVGNGVYFGFEKEVSAFVWLDEQPGALQAGWTTMGEKPSVVTKKIARAARRA